MSVDSEFNSSFITIYVSLSNPSANSYTHYVNISTGNEFPGKTVINTCLDPYTGVLINNTAEVEVNNTVEEKSILISYTVDTSINRYTSPQQVHRDKPRYHYNQHNNDNPEEISIVDDKPIRWNEHENISGIGYAIVYSFNHKIIRIHPLQE